MARVTNALAEAASRTRYTVPVITDALEGWRLRVPLLARVVSQYQAANHPFPPPRVLDDWIRSYVTGADAHEGVRLHLEAIHRDRFDTPTPLPAPPPPARRDWGSGLESQGAAGSRGGGGSHQRGSGGSRNGNTSGGPAASLPRVANSRPAVVFPPNVCSSCMQPGHDRYGCTNVRCCRRCGQPGHVKAQCW